MGYIKSLLVPRPVQGLNEFLLAHPEKVDTQRMKLILRSANEVKLKIAASIDYPGYEGLVADFHMPTTLPPIQTIMPEDESIYADFIRRTLHDAQKRLIIVCGAGLDAPVVSLGRFLDDFKDYSEDIKKAVIQRITLKVLFYGPTELTKRLAKISKEMNYTIFTPNWTRHLLSQHAQVEYTRDNTIEYDEEAYTLHITLGSPVKDEVIRKMEKMAKSYKTKLLLAIGISFRPDDRLSEMVKLFIRNKKWIIFLEISDSYSVQDISKDMCCVKIVDKDGALAIFKDEFFGERTRSFEKDRPIL